MANKNFIVKNGLEVGGQEVVSSSGVVTSAALGGQTLSSTDSPTFNNLTLTNDIAVGGDLNLTGDLNITGDVNSLSVTDLDVTDQTITLGAGQVESASGGSGIVVDGSGASILWDETNTEWDFNNSINVTGTVVADGLTVDGNGSLLTFNNGSNPATISNTNGNITTDFDTTNLGRNYTIQANSINAFRIANGGDISFYEDTGTTAKLFWDASAESLGIGTTNPQTDLNIVNQSGATLDINTNLAGADSKILLHEGTSASPTNGASIRYDGANNLFKIGVGSSVDTTRLTIDRDTGKVGINEDNPIRRLHVNSSTDNMVARFESTDSVGGIELMDNAGSVELEAIGEVFNVHPGGLGTRTFTSSVDNHLFTTTYVHGDTSTHFDAQFLNTGTANRGPRVRIRGGGQSSGVSSAVPWDSQQGYDIGSLWFDSSEGPSIFGAGIAATAESDWNANDTPSALAFYTTPDQTGAQTNTAKERLRISSAGISHFSPTESDTRIYLGSQGGLFGGNSSNWVRASESSLMYNSALGGTSTGTAHIWECTGAQRMNLSGLGKLTVKTANTADAYTANFETSTSGDPGISIVRPSIVGFGIAVRSATTDYADFQINNDGEPTFTEAGKLRLYSNGTVDMPGGHSFNVNDGWSFLATTGRVFQTFNYNSAGAEVFLQNNRTSGGTVAAFQYRINNSSQSGGTILASTSGYTGGNFSDYRLKNNVANLTGSLDKITQLRAISYNHVDTPDKTELGFIAHEINEVFPEFVHGEKDAVWTQEDIDNYEGYLPDVQVGDVKAQQVDYFSKEWTTHILHAIKELKTELDAAKARITELEG